MIAKDSEIGMIPKKKKSGAKLDTRRGEKIQSAIIPKLGQTWTQNFRFCLCVS